MANIRITEWEIQEFPFITKNYSQKAYINLLQRTTNLYGSELKKQARALARKEICFFGGVISERAEALASTLEHKGAKLEVDWVRSLS
jgi:hypothetical protein